jgi:hypothetical protein
MSLADLEGSLAQVKLDPTENCEAAFHRKSTCRYECQKEPP